MLTRADVPRLMTSGLRTEFFNGYNGVEPTWKQMVLEVNSTKAEETYDWLGDTPALREWIDNRQPSALAEFGFTAKNKDYEATLAVDRNVIEDDQYGQVKTRARMMGENVAKDMEQIFTTFIEAGTTTVCYDGQYYFDTDHSEGDSGTQSNYLTSTALSAANAKVAISRMRGFKNDKGRKCGIKPTHILVPTALEWTARSIFEPKAVDVSTDPTAAVLSGILKVIVNDYLTEAGTAANSAWYILALGGAMKPFVFQNRKNPEFVSLDKSTDHANFFSKTLYYGIDARFRFVYGDWRYAVKAIG